MTSDCICKILFKDVEWGEIIVAALAQHLLGFLWYGSIFTAVYQYYTAADKGVKRVEYVVQRFGMTVCSIGTVLSGVLRALFIAAIAKQLNVSSICALHEVAAFVAILAIVYEHHSLWAQRPLPLILINSGYEIAAALTGATVLFYIREAQAIAAIKGVLGI
jgi:hypothetical protein